MLHGISERPVMLGPNLLLSALDGLLKIVDLCNRYGLDTISLGATLAFAIEIYQEGIITQDDTDGLVLNWGDSDVLIEITDWIGRREGFENLLTDGVQRSADHIGHNPDRFAINIGGQEIPAHDPLYEPGLRLVYIANATPGRHDHVS